MCDLRPRRASLCPDLSGWISSALSNHVSCCTFEFTRWSMKTHPQSDATWGSDLRGVQKHRRPQRGSDVKRRKITKVYLRIHLEMHRRDYRKGNSRHLNYFQSIVIPSQISSQQSRSLGFSKQKKKGHTGSIMSQINPLHRKVITVRETDYHRDQ